MKIRTVWIKYDRTFDLGEPNKINLACTLEADVADDENFVDTIADLQEIARLSVKKEFDRLPRIPTPQTTEETRMRSEPPSGDLIQAKV